MSERASLIFLKDSIDEVREIAADIMDKSTTELTLFHPIRFASHLLQYWNAQ